MRDTCCALVLTVKQTNERRKQLKKYMFIHMQLHFDTKNTGYMYVCECVHVCVHFIILFVSVLKK